MKFLVDFLKIPVSVSTMKHTYRIVHDESPTSPSAYADDSLFIVSAHRDFYIPAPGEKRVPATREELIRRFKKTHWIFPIEAYIHSGICLAFSGEGNFPDRQWDVSQVGYVFAAKKEWRLNKSARKAAECKINEWNQYLSGDVWGYIIEDGEGNEVDSCWGYYGRENCEYCAEEALKSYNKE